MESETSCSSPTSNPGAPAGPHENTGMPAHGVRCLKEAGPYSVWLIERPGQEPRTLKTWPLTLPTALKLLVGGAQAQRQLRGSRRLARLNVRTPQPIGRWALRRLGGRWRVTIELHFAPGRSVRDMFTSGGIDERTARASALQIGRFVRAMANARLTHRDLKLNNIVIEEAADGPVVWLVDTVGVRPAWSRRRGLMQMLERLFFLAAWVPAARHRWVWAPVLHEALKGLSARDRREAFRIMRRRFRWQVSTHPACG